MKEENITTLAGSFLSRLSLFSGLDETEFALVIELLKIVRLNNGESVFNEGDTGKEMYIFFSGALSAYGTQPDGTQRKLFDIQQGDFFGEMSIISHEPRSATITATEDSILIMLKESDFFRIISDYPATGYKILRAISVVQNIWLDQSSKSYSDLLRWGENARRRAITDEMTGLYNRSFLEESLNERFNNHSMKLRAMSLLMMDLDRIHDVNDQYGIKAGDIVINAAADVIRSCLRPGDISARLAGDEFAVILPDTEIDNAVIVAEQIRVSIEKQQIEVPAKHETSETVFIKTRTSIGIASAPAHAGTTEDLMLKSDIALRKAKNLGRNRIEIFA